MCYCKFEYILELVLTYNQFENELSRVESNELFYKFSQLLEMLLNWN